MTNRVLGFLTDLGDVDDAVANCKGVMLWINPQATLVDITHKVTPFDVWEGSWYLKDTTRYFPPNAVFCAFVWPTVGMGAEMLALKNASGQIYVVPNNGLITHAHQQCPIVEAYHVTSSEVMWHDIADTFPGRDVIATAAAHLSNDFPIENVGPVFDLDKIVLLPDTPLPVISEERIDGIISLIDRNYGNVWTNIPEGWLTNNLQDGEAYCVSLNGRNLLVPLQDVFGKVPKGEPLLYINSRGNLALGLNQGSFAKRFGVERGMAFHIQLRKMPHLNGIRRERIAA